jgi:XTP/dITP diphosphohydrolase
MQRLVLATNNRHKVAELSLMLGQPFKIVTLHEAGIVEELAEDADTLEGNSLQKANYVYAKTKLASIADDTGLEVDALHGAPGVFSARYAGPQRNANDNIKLLLQNLEGIQNRKAHFRTVITLVCAAGHFAFEGIVEGEILREPIGEGGFGYDPVFLPMGFSKTFAELTLEEKNKVSHRARATEKLLNFLRGNLTWRAPTT